MVRRKLFALIVCLSFINCTLSDSNDDAIKDVINTSNTETRNPKPVRINTHQSSSDCVYVPYYLRNNYSIITIEDTLIDVKQIISIFF